MGVTYSKTTNVLNRKQDHSNNTLMLQPTDDFEYVKN